MLRKLIAGLCLFALLACPADAVRLCQRGLCGGKAVLWTPLNDPNLVAWWNSQNLASITFNGSNVAAWTDLKSGIVASQVTGASQPVWSATARNGKPGLTFNGSQFLTFTPTGFPSGASVGTIIVAAFSALTNPGSQTFGFTYGAAASTASQSRLSFQDTTGVVGFGQSGATNAFTSETWNASDRLQIVNLTSSSTVQNVDGLAAETTVTSAPNTLLATGSIGKWQFFGGVWNGAGQQYIVSAGTPTTSVRQKYEGWESWYDGKAGANLPAGHPYKSRAPFVSDL